MGRRVSGGWRQGTVGVAHPQALKVMGVADKGAIGMETREL